MTPSRNPKDEISRLLGGAAPDRPTSGLLDVAMDHVRVDVAGVGRLRSPVTPAQARALCSLASPAPFGLGEETRVDPAVRHTWQVPTTLVSVDWGLPLADVLEEARDVLALPEGTRLAADLHSVLVYEKGQFFLPHRDSEKEDAMVATLVITLPSRHTGGELVVQDGGRPVTFRGSPSHPNAVVFYADRVHEVLPVRSGHRVSLTYNLAVTHLPPAGPAGDDVGPVARLLQRHFTTRPRPRWSGDSVELPIRYAYLLDHAYTPRALAWSSLKGTDIDRARLIQAAAVRLDGEAVLALTDVHETWNAEVDDTFSDDWGDEGDDWGNETYDADGPEPSELIDSDVVLTHWLEPGSARAQPVSLPLDAAEVGCSTPSARLTPYDTQYEGYMGNYGNTVDRWYHRAAVVVWPRTLAFANRAEASPAWALGNLGSRLTSGQADGIAADVDSVARFWRAAARGSHAHEELLGQALLVGALLDDAASASVILEPFSLESLRPEHGAAVVALAARHGDDWAATLLGLWHANPRGSLLRAGSDAWLDALPELAASLSPRPTLAEAALAGLVGDLEAHMGALVARAPTPSRRDAFRQLGRTASAVLAATVPGEVTGLRDRVVASCRSRVDCLPTLVTLVQAAAEWPDSVWTGGRLDELAADAGARLREELSVPARPPSDWSIITDLGCTCDHCQRLATFLGDPNQRVMDWRLAQDGRRHIHHRIDSAELPVTHTTRRIGRPFTLVLTKTADLFEREARDRRDGERDLAEISDIVARRA